MGDEKNNKSIGEQTVKDAAKMAANSYAGPIGRRAVDEISEKYNKNDSSPFASKLPAINKYKPTNPSNFETPSDNLKDSSDLHNKDDGLEAKKEDNLNKKNNNNNNNNVNNETEQNHLSENTNESNENIVTKIKNMPSWLKQMISFVGSYIFTAIVIIISVSLIAAATTILAEKLYDGLVTSKEAVTSFFQNAANFFATITGSNAERAEHAYYNKLDAIYDEFDNEYGVSIDTTLITATLFYGRTLEDYSNEKFLEDDSGQTVEDDDLELYEGESADSGDASFYKVAKKHIRTLAKFMLVQNTAFNKCVEPSKVDHVVVPSSPREVAKNWTSISIFSQLSHNVWNTYNDFTYINYEPITFTNTKEQSVTIENWCRYEDAHEKLEPYYLEDRDYYLEKKHAYEFCVESHKAACRSSCEESDYNCYSNCDGNYDNECSVEKSEYDKVAKIFHENWTVEGLYDEDDHFTCKETSKWGPLAKYDDRKKFYNHMFDEDLKNKAIVPNFLEKYSYYIEKEPDITCSTEPAISYDYDVDTSEEGVYYYKLMTKTSAWWFQKKESFIERYYRELLPDNYDELSEEEQELSQKRIVDEIFLLYYTAASDRYRNGKFCYTPTNENSIGVQDGNQGSINNSSQSEFVKSISPFAVDDMQASGIPASVTIAQAIIESSSGKSLLTTDYNNYFGMTAAGLGCSPPRRNDTKPYLAQAGTDGNTCTGNAYWNGDLVWMCNKAGADCQWYRVYNGLSNSVHDHSAMLSNSKYNCQGLTPEKTLYCIQHRKDGKRYADNDNYESSLISLINRLNLTQYDIGEWAGEVLTEFGSEILGTRCFETAAMRDEVAGGGIESGEGTIQGIVNGQRTALYGTPEYNIFWKSENNLFYASNKNLLKQCTWYAHGRALEILTSNGMSLATAKQYLSPMRGNAGLWFGQNQYFSSSTAVNNPKPGAIIVWSRAGQPGHVAIVESVEYDSNGKAIGVSLSEGGKSIDGFRYTAHRDISYIASHGSYRFVGYVYLLG